MTSFRRAAVGRIRLPSLSGKPSRALASVNLRHEEKALFDHLHSYWSLRAGRPLRQVDAFSLLFALALSNEQADVPAEVEARLRARGSGLSPRGRARRLRA